MSKQVDFDQLWAIANREAQRSSETPQSVFWPIGLMLVMPPQRWKYYCTPLNVKTFAHTGCDGIHYSFLEMSDRPLSDSPVVMTVPANYHEQNVQNVIVGENLYGFLCLGCRGGYSVLEEFSYSNGQLAPLRSKHYVDHLNQQQIQQLEILNQAFLLEPWTDLDEQMIGLNSTYFSHLIISDEMNNALTDEEINCQLEKEFGL